MRLPSAARTAFAAFGEAHFKVPRTLMPDRDDINGPNGHETPDSAADYIATLTEELARLARRNGLETLGYILEMARLEADHIVKR